MSARRPEFFFVLCRLTVFAQGKWFTKMLSVCKGQQRICGSRIRRSLERRSHCLEIQIFAAAQSQLCQLFYSRMFVCVNSSSESIIVFLLLPRSQQKFLPRFHSAVLLSLSCRLVAGCCGKLFRKTPLARLTMHQQHFSVCSSSSPLHWFGGVSLCQFVSYFPTSCVAISLLRSHIWWESYIWCQLERLKVVPLHQKYAGLCNSALSDLSPCYQACHASQDSGPRVFCQEYGFQSPLMESCEQFLCQPWYHLSISSLCLSSISYSLLPYNILRLRPDVWRCLSVTSKKSPRWLWDFRNLSFLWKVFCEK